MKNTICVIGGGASGIMCSIFASKNNNVILIEKNEKVGKKILATGNGRCNLTNLNVSNEFYNHNLDKFFNVFDNKKTLEFFEKLGLVWYADEQQRVYPFSNSATSVVDCLSNALQNSNVSVKTGEEFECVKKQNSNYIVTTNKGEYVCDKVVFCCGGAQIKEVLENLGAKYIQTAPSLVSLKTEKIKELSGLRVSNVEVTLSHNNVEYKECGEVLFKDEGLSGICVFNLSAYLARNKNYNAKIYINFAPKYSFNELFKILTNRLNLKGFASDYLTGFLHYSLNNYLLKKSKINPKKLISQITENEIKLLIKNIQKCEFNVVGAYANNQVFSGGVDLNCLNDNLSLKNDANIFVTGELCDVDGLCGGYNLQWAWTSGYIVGKNL